MTVSKITFGPEPRDYEVQEFLMKNYYSLRFSPAVAAAVKENHVNPKRIQRQVRRELQDTGMGTKSQQALKLQQEQIAQLRPEPILMPMPAPQLRHQRRTQLKSPISS